MKPGKTAGSIPLTMNSSLLSSFRLVCIALLPVLLSPSFGAEAAESPPAPARKTSADDRLIITNGVFSRNGENVPATVRNLVDLVAKRFPDANITIVGVENVVIDNLALTLRKTKIFDELPNARQPLDSVLMAFSEASGRKFVVRGFSENDFLLVAEGPASNHRTTEVFNLSTVVKQARSNAGAEEVIRRLEAEISVFKNRYTDQHPKLVEARERLEIEKAQMAKTTVVSDTNKLIEQIQDAVRTTLRVKPDELPEFRYHAGTNLFVVTGSVDAIDLTRKVIAALEKSP